MQKSITLNLNVFKQPMCIILLCRTAEMGTQERRGRAGCQFVF